MVGSWALAAVSSVPAQAPGALVPEQVAMQQATNSSASPHADLVAYSKYGIAPRLSSEFCRASFADPGHIFRRMWADQGWGTSRTGERHGSQRYPLCWEGSPHGRNQTFPAAAFFDAVFTGDECGRRVWNDAEDPYTLEYQGLREAADRAGHEFKAILGFDDDIDSYCRAQIRQELSASPDSLRRRLGPLAATVATPNGTVSSAGVLQVVANLPVQAACMLAGYTMLAINETEWNQCYNLEWQLCAARGRLARVSRGGIVFATPPHQLDPTGLNGGRPLAQCGGPAPVTAAPGSRDWRPSSLDDGIYGYTNDDIYYMEVCSMDAMCANSDAIWTLGAGEPFECVLSTSKYRQMQAQLLSPADDALSHNNKNAYCVRNITAELRVRDVANLPKDNSAYRVWSPPGTQNSVWTRHRTEGGGNGTYGGTCACPDGAWYMVSDGGTDCASLLCHNGQAGLCQRQPGPWSLRGVTCHRLEDGVDAAASVAGHTPLPALPPAHLATRFTPFPHWGDRPQWTFDDFRSQCEDATARHAQQAWLERIESSPPSADFQEYLRNLYGADSSGLDTVVPRHMRYYWNSAPGRESFNASFTTVRCTILGLTRENMLFAPIDDAQHSPSLLTEEMIERCNRPRCQHATMRNAAECLDVPIPPASAASLANVTGAALRAKLEHASSEMRICLARGLEAFSNFSAEYAGASTVRGGSEGSQWALTFADGRNTILSNTTAAADGEHHSVARYGVVRNARHQGSVRAQQMDGVDEGTDPTAFSVGDAGHPPLPYAFPGFFVLRDASPAARRRYADAAAGGISAHGVTPDAAGVSSVAPPPFPIGSMGHGMPDHTWVEIMRVGRIDDKVPVYEQADRSTIGQVWFWLAPGSGIWWNTGRTLVVNASITTEGRYLESPRACTTLNEARAWWTERNEAFGHVTCAAAMRDGYDSIQLTSSFCGYSWELIDCRGANRPDAHTTWTAACPPPHVLLMRGLPMPRLAPALDGVRGKSSGCACASSHDFVNCDASEPPVIEQKPAPVAIAA